jgi:hypothetical protein
MRKWKEMEKEKGARRCGAGGDTGDSKDADIIMS